MLGATRRVVVIGDGVTTDLAWAKGAGWAAVHIGTNCSHPPGLAVGCLPSLAEVAALL